VIVRRSTDGFAEDVVRQAHTVGSRSESDVSGKYHDGDIDAAPHSSGKNADDGTDGNRLDV